jgi:Fur family transcriptional regulator, ferric uptake regulator
MLLQQHADAKLLDSMANDQALEALRVLKRKGYRMTPQRQAIVTEVMRSKGHIIAPAISARVQAIMPGVTPSTIYRTLDMLEGVGLISHSHLERGAEYHHAGESGHVHLTCSRCGAEDDLSLDEAEALERLITKHHGFRPDLTHFAISGVCRSCQEELRR